MQRAAWKHIRTNFVRAGFLLAVVVSSGTGNAHAQQPPAGLPGGQRAPGGGGGMRPGGFGGPGMGGEFGKWMDEHKNVMAVRRKVGRIEQMNKTPDTQLTKAQAAKMLTIINAWKSKPNMTEDQAKSVDAQLTTMLNDKQRKALEARGQGGFGGGDGGRGGRGAGGGPGGMAKGGPGAPGGPPSAGKMAGGMRPGGPGAPGGPRGMRPGGFGGPGGPGGMAKGGPGGGQGFTLPKTMNPFNPASMSGRMQERAKKNMDELTAALQKQAK